MTLLDQARAVLAGDAHPPLDDGATKVLSFMLKPAGGCDATITADRFWIQYSWHLAYHRYTPALGPTVLAYLHTFARDGQLPPGLLPWWGSGKHELPYWAYGRRTVWFEDRADRVMIYVRDEDAGLDRSALPPPVEPPIEYVVLAHACPHCAAVPERYRKLRGGGLVCLACGASSAERG